jgi:cytochrome c oxidase subunit 2
MKGHLRGASNKRRAMTLLLVVSALLLAAACGATPQSILEPTTASARRSLELLSVVFWASVVVFVLVEGALVYVLIRYRRRRGDGLPRQTHGNTRLEIAWSIAPVILVVVIAVLTVPKIFADADGAEADTLRVRAIGHQWWFEFVYPELGIVTANELHLPVGRSVEIQLKSDDVLHSFWVPRLRGKLDMVPGRVNKFVITPESSGTFLGQCAEFCGIAHALMKFRVVVESEAAFDAWVANEKTARAPPASEQAQAGEALLAAKGCVACHTIRGTNAAGVIGPELTHVGSRSHIAAGILPNTREGLSTWLSGPQDVKPGNFMVIPELSDDEVEYLVTYLQGLK